MRNNQDVDMQVLQDETNEELALRLAEQEVEAHKGECFLAYRMGSKAWGWLAYMWGCSRNRVRDMAKVAEVFTEDDFIPGIPISIYMEAVKVTRALWRGEHPKEPIPEDHLRLGATHWLKLATDGEYRHAHGYSAALGRIWHTRQMKEAALPKKESGESPVTFRGDRATVEQWDPGADRLTITGAGISGDPPVRVKVAVTPLLEVAT
jgi:hypothetical protein